MKQHDPTEYNRVAFRDGNGYTSYCPEIRGCMSQGDTVEGAMDNLLDAIKDMMDSLREDGLPIPEPATGIVTVDFENLWDWNA